MITHPNPRRGTTPRALLFVVLLLLPSYALAQTSGSVTGTVKDAKTGAPLVAATVTLRKAIDTTAAPLGDLTDDKGVFVIERVPLDVRYTLEVTYLGYEKS